MKKSKIRTGGVYTDNKGGLRKVLAEGPEFIAYPSQECRDNLKYKVIAKKLGPYRVGAVRNCTRASFAAWAKSEVLPQNQY